jgi:hypothetical protein
VSDRRVTRVVRIYFQDGTSLERTLRPGWNPIGGPFGAHFGSNGPRHWLRLSCGVLNSPQGAGAAYVARVEVDVGAEAPSILPRAGWQVHGSTIVLGSGAEVFPARSALVVRWADAGQSVIPPAPPSFRFDLGGLAFEPPPSLAVPEVWRVERVLAALREGKADAYAADLYSEALGFWHPRGEPYCAVGGARGITPVAGWERSWVLCVLAADLQYERTPVDALDVSTGDPLLPAYLPAPDYSLGRGWSKTGQLPQVCAPSSDPYDPARAPRVWRPGSAPYASRLLGLDRYHDYLPPDGQHLIRTTSLCDAAVQLWGDPVARLHCFSLASDCRLAWRSVPTAVKGQGSSSLGRRECSWVGWTLLASNRPSDVAFANRLVDACLEAAMPHGGVMRLGSDFGELGSNHGLVPNPWRAESIGTKPIPPTSDVEQEMERVFLALLLARAARWDEARHVAGAVFLPRGTGDRRRPSFVEEFGYLPKFCAVADLHGAPHRAIVQGAGEGDYFGQIMPGLLACFALARGPDGREWLPGMRAVGAPTLGRGSDDRDLERKLRTDPAGPGQTLFALSALERLNQ